jgi:GDP-L-fucose synthase
MRLYIAGINGMVGSAVATEASNQGMEVIGKSSKTLDLTDRSLVFKEFSEVLPDALIICAAKVGGIGANFASPVDFLSVNLQIQTNLLDAAHSAGIKRVLFLGSSCIYPKYAPQPIIEASLLTGPLESTNEAYAIAKIAGLKLVQAYRQQYGKNWISAMPTNLYGPKDNFDLNNAHVLPALINRMHFAKHQNLPSITLWGDGTALREFLHVQDLARACMLLLNEYDSAVPINIGSGHEISILSLAKLIAGVVGYEGLILFENNDLNGTPRKLLDSTILLSKGWKPQVTLQEGIASTYEWFLENTHERKYK